MRRIAKTNTAAGAAVAASFVSALCCAGPLLAVAVGVSGAGLGSRFEPLHPYFLVLTALSLAVGPYLLQREERKACEPGTPCGVTGVHRQMRRTLWVATFVAIVFATYPGWSAWVI